MKAWGWALSWVVLLATVAARGGSIFDDDYVPPSSKKTPVQPGTARPTTAPTTTSTPVATRPDGGGFPTARVPLAVPPRAEQAKSRALLKEAYAKELADRTPAARRRLAAKLFAEASAQGVSPADQFVLLAGARQAAIDGGDWDVCFGALDAMAGTFGTDQLVAKLEVVAKGPLPRAEDATAASINGRAGLALADELAASNDFATANRILTGLAPACSTDPLLGPLLTRRARELAAAQNALDRVRPSLSKLSEKPADPSANSAVGKFTCFYRVDWTAGLPLLARGGDAALAALATRDLAAGTADELQAAGDAWWEFAARASGDPPVHAAASGRAMTLYGRAIDAGATGLERTAMRKRIDDNVVPRLVDVLKLAKPDDDAIRGDWALGANGLRSDKSLTMYEFGYELPREYVVRIDFTQPGPPPQNAVAVALSRGEIGFTLIVGGYANTFAGLENLAAKGGDEWAAAVRRAHWLEPNVRYVTTVEVRDGRVRVSLNGEPIVDRKTDYQEFTPFGGDFAGKDVHRLGLGTFKSVTCFHHVDVLELSGPGHVVK